MRFIETDNKDYIAVDTIARFTDVVIHYREHEATPERPRPFKEPVRVSFKVITKRGEVYPAELNATSFYSLVRGV